jgi:hypothetical protein
MKKPIVVAACEVTLYSSKALKHASEIYLHLYVTSTIPVGIPSTLEPRPKPLMTGPPINHGSIGKVPSIPVQKN